MLCENILLEVLIFFQELKIPRSNRKVKRLKNICMYFNMIISYHRTKRFAKLSLALLACILYSLTIAKFQGQFWEFETVLHNPYG